MEKENRRCSVRYVRLASAMRATLFCAWANDLKGFLWWCNADQEELHFPPYDWSAYERELGMLRPDLSPKPIMVEMRRFDEFRRSLPFARLPPRRTDCVIVVPERTAGRPECSALTLRSAGAIHLRSASTT